jgi:hypothetical protein
MGTQDKFPWTKSSNNEILGGDGMSPTSPYTLPCAKCCICFREACWCVFFFFFNFNFLNYFILNNKFGGGEGGVRQVFFFKKNY